MPKPVKNAAKKSVAPKRPASDPNRRAHQMMAEMDAKQGTGPAPEPESFEAQLKAHMSKIGSKGGKVSGAKRMDMPVEERRRIASLAARAMWKKRKAAKQR